MGRCKGKGRPGVEARAGRLRQGEGERNPLICSRAPSEELNSDGRNIGNARPSGGWRCLSKELRRRRVLGAAMQQRLWRIPGIERATPAMQTGLSEHAWSLEDLIALLASRTAKAH